MGEEERSEDTSVTTLRGDDHDDDHDGDIDHDDHDDDHDGVHDCDGD